MQVVIEENPESEKKAENPTRACKQGVPHDLHSSCPAKLHLQVSRGQTFPLLPWAVPWSSQAALNSLGTSLQGVLWAEQGDQINEDNL